MKFSTHFLPFPPSMGQLGLTMKENKSMEDESPDSIINSKLTVFYQNVQGHKINQEDIVATLVY